MSKFCSICRNTDCNNHGKNITFYGDNWECKYIPVPTNADRIRAMSDDELAEAISSIPMCVGTDDDKDCENDGCKGCFLKWLQQPAEEAEYD